MYKPKPKPTHAAIVPVDVTVRIDGRRWRHVLTLSASRPTDRHFILEAGPHGSTEVRFGDGVRGASPRRASIVVVTFRTDNRDVQVKLRRTTTQPTRDQALWVAIRNRTKAIAFSG